MTRERNSVWVTSEQSAHARSTSQQRVTNRSVDACRLEDTERSFCPAPHRSDPPDGFGDTPREPGDGGVSLTPPQPRVLRAEGLWPGVAPLDGVDPARDATEPDGRLDDPGVGPGTAPARPPPARWSHPASKFGIDCPSIGVAGRARRSTLRQSGSGRNHMRVVLTRVGTVAVILVLGLAGVFTASPAPAGGLGRGSDFGRKLSRLSLLQPRALRRHPA